MGAKSVQATEASLVVVPVLVGEPAGVSVPTRIRPLGVADRAVSARLHEEVFDREFLVRCGPAFLRTYHRAWIDSSGAIALGALDGNDDLVGVLLGALDPAGHAAGMVRRHGLALGGRLAARAVAHPRLARELLATRGVRYARGLGQAVARLVAGRVRRESGSLAPQVCIGEVTHLLVAPAHQGRGVGRAMLAAMESQARQAGLEELVLVTPPDQEARGFYERLGWAADGDLRSRSGEAFVRYRYQLG